MVVILYAIAGKQIDIYLPFAMMPIQFCLLALERERLMVYSERFGRLHVMRLTKTNITIHEKRSGKMYDSFTF